MKRKKELSKEARFLRMYRQKPSIWLQQKIRIEPARYRSQEELQAWLDRQPADSHSWAREQLGQGRLKLDSTRSYQTQALDMMAVPGWYAFQWCNGAAKTATAALFVHWFLDCFPGGKVLTTAGTWSQLKEQLWREIASWATRTKMPIAANSAPQGIGKTQIDIAPDWAAFGRAADQGATFEGVHAQHVLVLMDEAKAIKPEIFESVRRILRGNPGAHFWWVCLSSPGSPSGPFFDITNGEQAHRWTTLRMSAYEASRVDLSVVKQDAEDLGESSPLFISMDLGEFPEEGDDVIIPLSLAQSAVGRIVNTSGRPVLAVDVARLGGDETVFGRFRNRAFDMPLIYQGKRTTETAGHLVRMRHEYGTMAIDDGGVGGGGVDMALEENLNVLAINAGSKSPDPHYFDLGTNMAFAVRRELELGQESQDDPDVGISLPEDKRLLHQLAARKYEVRRNGQLKAESKADMRKRGEKSPDRSDTLNMGWWVRAGEVVGSSLSANSEDQRTTFGGLREQAL